MRKTASEKTIIGSIDLKIKESKIHGDYQVRKQTNMSYKKFQPICSIITSNKSYGTHAR